MPLARALLTVPILALACEAEELAPYPGEELAGGTTTVFDDTQLAYSLVLSGLDHEQRGHHFVGNAFFSDGWVQAPSSTEGRDGLGPTFNARSCSACHFHDGRGAPPAPDEAILGLLFRLSVPGEDEQGGPKPEPTYGDQLQPYAIQDVPGEGTPVITYEERPGRYGDGEPYSLRHPSYRFDALAFGPLADDVLVSPRVAPAVFGLGLLEAIDEAEIVARSDPEDLDDDGISGRVNRPFDPVTGARALGRLGWKANQVGLEQQTAGAFLGDLGITTALHLTQNCGGEAQVECRAAIEGGTPEAEALVLERVTFYGRTLAVPARRDVDEPEVLAGRALFERIGCADCHVPRQLTGHSPTDLPQVEQQTIWPYTDLLLHDMGDALADGRPDFDADGREWRTPPLWGLGLLYTVNDHELLLHDGRARGPAEAILWHGGEAEPARETFRELSKPDREALLRFLRSL